MFDDIGGGIPDPTDFSDPLGPVKIENMVGHDITGGGGNGGSGCCGPGCAVMMLMLPFIMIFGFVKERKNSSDINK
jgi:hypothetical protein